MGGVVLASKLNILQYTDEAPTASTLAVVLTKTCRFRNQLLSQVKFPNGLKLIALFRKGVKLSDRLDAEFACQGDTLVFENHMDVKALERLVL